MIVMKFGGTSVQDVAAIHRLCAIVASRAHEAPLVVVSALAGVTDDLDTLCELAALERRAAVEDMLASLAGRHGELAAGLGIAQTAADRLGQIHGDLSRDLDAAWGRPFSDAERDRVLGIGEALSSLLVAGALMERGLPAEWFDARDVIATDDRFTRATPRQGEIRDRAARHLTPLLEDSRIPVTQGFVGRAPDGRPSTLGRGGGDFTASLLGAALDVERVEIWTDVDGIMTADPRLVRKARVLSRATYEEVAEMATFGASVLHPATQAPLAERRIPIFVLNSMLSDAAGTIITDDGGLDRPEETPVRSVSWRPGVLVVNVRAPRMFGAYGFLRRLFEVFERFQIPVDVLASGEVSVSLTVDDRDWRPAVVDALSRLGAVSVAPGRAIVSVVGVGLRNTPGIAARAFHCIDPVNVEMISQGSSAINLTFVVKEEDGPRVVRSLHEEFFG